MSIIHRFSHKNYASRYIPLDGVNFSPGGYITDDAIVLPKLWWQVGRQRETHLTNNNQGHNI